MNNKIQSGNIISWKDFNSLKDYSNPRISFYPYDLNLFHNFYANLHRDHHDNIGPSTKENFIQEADNLIGRTNEDQNISINEDSSVLHLPVSNNGVFCE